MSKTVGKPSKGSAFLMMTMVLVSSFSVLLALCPGVIAAADTVTLTDAQNNDLTAVKGGTVVYINVNDGTTTGGTKTATIKERGQANQITITIYDNGALMGDTSGDGKYLGMFNLTNKNGGGTTNQGTGELAVPDAAIVDGTANLDGDASSGTDSIVADFSKPVVTITSADDIVLNGNYYLRITATDANIKIVQFQVDSGNSQPTQPQPGNVYLATIDTDALTEEIHEITVTVGDNATNENSDWVNITVDRTPPEVTIRPSSKFVMSSFFLNVTVSDTNLNESTIKYRLDAEALQDLPKVAPETFTQTLDVSSASEGQHTVFIQASDLADNINNTQSVKFTVDRTKAAIIINSPADSVVKDVFVLNVTVTDENIAKNEIKYKVDGGNAVIVPEKGMGFFEATINTVPLSEGAHNVVVTEKDMAGNVNTTQPFSFTVDKTQPNITITSATSGYYRESYTLSCEVNDANLDTSKVFYLTDGANPLPLPWAKTGIVFSKVINVSAFTEKNYALSIKSIDKAGNTREVGGVTMIVDRTPPAFTYSFKRSGNDYRLEVLVNDPNLDAQTVFYSLDGGAKKEFDNIVSNSYSAVISAASYSEGSHNFTIYAGDKAGNIKEQTYNDIVMDPPPLISGLNAVDLYDGKIKVSWNPSPATDLNHYNLYYRAFDIITDVSGLSPSNTTTETSITITGLVVGTRYYFAVTAVDDLGYENKTVQPTTATSKESIKLPTIEITKFTASKTSGLRVGDTVTFEVTIENKGTLDGKNIKIRLVDNNNEVATEMITLLSPGQTEVRSFDWAPEEGDHNVSAEVVMGVQVLAEMNFSSTAMHVDPEKTQTTENNWFNPYYILVLVGAIIGVAVLVGIWRMTKKQDEEIKKEEIELGLRPDKDGKIHKPGGDQPAAGAKPSGPAKPSHSPDIQLPSSPLLQQPPAQQPPAQPPQAAPPEQQYQFQQPPPQQPPQQ